MRYFTLPFYFLRIWVRDLFRYPTATLHTDTYYTEYWSTRRTARTDEVSPWEKARGDLIITELKRAGGAKTLGDIGSGDGALLAYIARAVGATATAYDFSPAALEEAGKRGVAVVSLDVRHADERQRIARADYVLMLEVLEHVADSEELLLVAYHASEKGVFFSVPNTGFFVHRLRLLLGRVPLQWAVHPGEHLRFWTLTDMRWWLKAQGYQNTQIMPYKGVPVLNKLLPGPFAAGILVAIRK
ncbi:MAG: class I SAM-dependent methyltransferase [Patescibacteria group bacterium]